MVFAKSQRKNEETNFEEKKFEKFSRSRFFCSFPAAKNFYLEIVKYSTLEDWFKNTYKAKNKLQLDKVKFGFQI